tara:strand:- start:879 stop:2864 length:1986 start_codon:yes stop_codon:yes gene_type:complete
MAKTIYNKIKSHKKQVTKKDDLLVIPGEEGGVKDVVTEINKNLGVNYSGEISDPDDFEKAMIADREKYGKTDMPLKDYIAWKELKNAQSGNVLFQGTEDGKEVDATTWSDQDVDSGNKTYTNIEQVETDGTPDKDPYLSPEYSEVLSRVEMGKRARTESSLDRKARRELRRDNRRLKRQAAANRRDAIRSGDMKRSDMTRRSAIDQGYGLDDKQKKILDYTNKNRKAGGTVSGNYNFDSDGNISGQKLENLSGADSKMGIGFTEQVSGNVGGKLHATKENIERYKKQYGTDAVIVDGMIQNPNSSNDQKSLYKMKGYSGFQQAPKSPKLKGKKAGELLGRAVGAIRDYFKKGGSDVAKQSDNVSTGPKFSKNTNTNNNLPAVQGNRMPAKSGEVVPFKGGSGPIKPSGMSTGAKIAAGGAALAGVGLATSLGSSDKPSNNDTPTVTPPSKTGKSYDQAYKDRDRKTYGHMNKSDYIKEAKRQNEVFKKTGKWDYKNAPKDPGPVSSIKPNKAVSVTAPGTKLEAKTLDTKKVDVDLSALDTRSEVKPNVSKKQEKLGNRIQRLEGRKSTPRRERRINKLQQKQAGVSRDVIRANKVIDKNTEKGFNALVDGNNVKAARNLGKVKRHVDKGNPAVVGDIKARENQLKAAAGFKQKGWSGFQK